MAKKTIVSIYKVDRAGVTGVQVGEGSLVEPQLVLVHPPLSTRIAAGKGPKRLRVGIRSNAEEDPLVEVIDGLEEPQVIRGGKSVEPLVGLELRTEAASPVDVINGLGEVKSPDELVALAVPLLKPDVKDGWNKKDEPRSPTDRHVFCHWFKKLCPPGPKV